MTDRIDALYGLDVLHTFVPKSEPETASYRNAIDELKELSVPKTEEEYTEYLQKCAEQMVKTGVAQLEASRIEQRPEIRSRLLRQGVLYTDSGSHLAKLNFPSVVIGTDTFSKAMVGLDAFLEGMWFAAALTGEKLAVGFEKDEHPLRVAQRKLFDNALNNYHRLRRKLR